MSVLETEQGSQNEVVALLPELDEVQPLTDRLHGIARIAGANIEYTFEQSSSDTLIGDDVPMLLVPGYGGVKSSYRQLRTNLAQMGKPAITYRPARSRGLRGDLSPDNLLRPNKLASQAAWAVMRDIRDQHGHETFDVSGHSMGGQTTASLAIRKSEYVRSAVFVASVGLDEHSVPQMLGRAIRFLPRELAPSLGQILSESEPRIALEALHYWLRNPQRSVAEGLATAACNLRQDLVEIDRRGVKTAAIQFQNDVFFPLDDVIKHSRHLFHAHHIYESPSSNHITPQTDARGVAAATMNILAELHPVTGMPLQAAA